MPLLSGAAEVSLSTLAMVGNRNLSHYVLVTPSGRTESTTAALPHVRKTTDQCVEEPLSSQVKI